MSQTYGKERYLASAAAITSGSADACLRSQWAGRQHTASAPISRPEVQRVVAPTRIGPQLAKIMGKIVGKAA